MLERTVISADQFWLSFRQCLAIALGGMCQHLNCVLHRREIDERWNVLVCRCNGGVPRIQCRFEYALLQFQVALANFILLIGEQLLQFLRVLLNRVCLIGKVEGQNLRVREPNDGRAYRL